MEVKTHLGPWQAPSQATGGRGGQTTGQLWGQQGLEHVLYQEGGLCNPDLTWPWRHGPGDLGPNTCPNHLWSLPATALLRESLLCPPPSPGTGCSPYGPGQCPCTHVACSTLTPLRTWGGRVCEPLVGMPLAPGPRLVDVLLPLVGPGGEVVWPGLETGTKWARTRSKCL